MKTYRLFFSCLIFWSFFFACEQNDADVEKDFSTTLEEANLAMEDVLFELINGEEPSEPGEIDFTTPYNLYNEAYEMDPTNPHANFGKALCGIFIVTQDQQVKDAFNSWQDYLNQNLPFEAPLQKKQARPISFPTSASHFNIPLERVVQTAIGTQKMALLDAPQLSTIQNILEARLLPKINFAIEAMDLIDDDETFTFMITPRMQGDVNEDALEVDLTEIYALEVTLNTLRALIDLAISYNVDFSGYDSLGILQALTLGSEFLTLRGEGIYLTQAQTSLLNAIDKLENGIIFLKNENDPQNDDIIKTGPAGVNTADLDSILAHTEDVRSFLTTVQTITGDWDVDSHTPQEDLDIDFSQFFTNPIQDFKTKLPPYTVTVSRDTILWLVNYTEDSTTINAEIDVDIENDYYFQRNYYWDKWGYVDDYQYFNLDIQDFTQAYYDKVHELSEMENILRFWVAIYFSDRLMVGPNGISTTLYWGYHTETAIKAIYRPIITWDASSFSEWIFPDPTFNNILPGLTDTEFKRIFGITEAIWEKTFD